MFVVLELCWRRVDMGVVLMMWLMLESYWSCVDVWVNDKFGSVG